MRTGTVIVVAVAVAAAAAGGYFAGQRAPGTQAAANAGPAPDGGRKVLYYRNPMGLPDTSPVPKKDSMGMDYIPVYEGEEPQGDGKALSISTQRIQKLGVRTEAATLRTLDKAVRAAGRVEVDERRVSNITPKFEGYVERLYVDATGEYVARGQPLFEAYSPELVAAQREYAIAARGMKSLREAGSEGQQGLAQLAESSLTRLRNWDVPANEIEALARTGEARRRVTFRSPASGIVLEKKALQGMRFMPGEMLYQVADLSRVWVIADVPEQDIGSVARGSKAEVRMAAYAEKPLQGVVTYVYPTLKTETRTIPVRIELANPGGRLKPGMYADVQLAAGNRGKVLAVPTSAIIDSGVRKVAIVQVDEGRFEPREVEVGQRGEQYVEVRSGVKEGESVVTTANFLIDAESNLRAALGGMGPSQSASGAAAPKATSHTASGRVESVDAAAGTVMIDHGPVETLKWPAMQMEFALANPSLAGAAKPGSQVAFTFVERKPGEWVVTEIRPVAALAAKGAVKPAGAGPHAGH